MRPGRSCSAPTLKWRALIASSRTLAPDDQENPVTNEEFAARCAALKVGQRPALAVSGGRDSMALVRLAADWAAQTDAKLRVFTVDHGLRAASGREAALTGEWCRALGLAHETLVWRGEKPAAGVQAAARAARYRLLAEAAAHMNADCLLTAHSADDQAETAFMRLARGAGPRGLAAMEDGIRIAAGAGPAVRLVRPLLPFSRARLTATVKALDQPYVDDPGNDDPAYERVRIRALLAALEQNGLLTRKALLQTAARMRAADERLRRAEEKAFAALGGCFYRWGGASLDRAAVERWRDDVSGLARRIIHAVSGAAHAPDEEAADEALAGALATGAATLGGVLMRAWRGGIWFVREPAAALGRAGVAPMAPLALKPGGAVLWDGRFAIEAGKTDDLEVRPLGSDPPADAQARLGLFSGPPEGLAAQPGVFRGAALIAAPAAPSMEGSGVAIRPLARERFAGSVIRFSQA